MILFVCDGNTCRSAMAEYIYNSLSEAKDARSAGIYASEGAFPSQNAVEVLSSRGIDMSAHRSRRITEKMLGDAEKVICMTLIQSERLTHAFPEYRNKIFCLSRDDIDDPYGGSIRVYEKCADSITEAIKCYLSKK